MNTRICLNLKNSYSRGINLILIISFLKRNYDNWFENEKSTDTKGGEEESNDLLSLRTLEGDEKE